jgi:uncharacterized membrane protein
MHLAVALFGLLIASFGITGLLSPDRLLGLVSRAATTLGLYVIAGIRLLLGIALVASASASRAPTYLQILGIVAIIAGLITPFFGVERFEAVLEWWRKWTPSVVRLWSVFVLLFGLSLVWAVIPADRIN